MHSAPGMSGPVGRQQPGGRTARSRPLAAEERLQFIHMLQSWSLKRCLRVSILSGGKADGQPAAALAATSTSTARTRQAEACMPLGVHQPGISQAASRGGTTVWLHPRLVGPCRRCTCRRRGSLLLPAKDQERGVRAAAGAPCSVCLWAKHAKHATRKNANAHLTLLLRGRSIAACLQGLRPLHFLCYSLFRLTCLRPRTPPAGMTRCSCAR